MRSTVPAGCGCCAARATRPTPSAREPANGGVVAAVGCACFSHGLIGVHGMRTRPAFRGRGLARRLLAAMGQAALRRDIDTAFLQVEADNQAARALI